ncbi:TPA: hypothetical protein QHU17_003986 [Enterobacter hormaechei subsp. xiangfangensis]|nr:hypothetical protein [Enterobacter hormaechei subsp. xiangfangensis]
MLLSKLSPQESVRGGLFAGFCSGIIPAEDVMIIDGPRHPVLRPQNSLRLDEEPQEQRVVDQVLQTKKAFASKPKDAKAIRVLKQVRNSAFNRVLSCFKMVQHRTCKPTRSQRRSLNSSGSSSSSDSSDSDPASSSTELLIYFLPYTSALAQFLLFSFYSSFLEVAE